MYFICFTSFLAKGQSLVLDVPNSTSPYGSDWCWAVCTHMATQYYGNETELCEIVEWARLNTSPSRGDDDCCLFPDSCYGGLYINYLDDVINSEGLSCTTIYDIVSLSTLQSTINEYRPLIILGYHSTPKPGYHNMIIKGYDGSYIHYNDGGSSYITSYNDAIAFESMGTFYWQWQSLTWILTSEHCPDELYLTELIDDDADFVAQSNIFVNCEIGSNINVSLTAGYGITFNSTFSIPLGSTLVVNVRSNPYY